MNLQPLVDLIKKASAWAALAALAWLGESGMDGGFIKDLWMAAKTASPFAAMFAVIVWMGERKERIDCQKQLNSRTLEYVNSVNEMVNAWNKMSVIIPMPRRRRKKL